MKRFKMLFGVGIILIFSSVVLALVPSMAEGAVPQLINFQGILKDGSGNPVANGIYSIRFRIHDDSTAGTSLWEETVPVQTVGGLFSVRLGDGTALPNTIFSTGANRFVGVKVNADTLAPRTRLISVPYALHSLRSDSAATATVSLDLTCASCVDAGDIDATQVQRRVTGTAGAGQYVTGINQDGSVVTAPDVGSSGSGWMDDGATVRLLTDADKVGIGTASPTKKLDVAGSIKGDTVFSNVLSSNSPLSLQVPAGTTRMYIDDITGNVGVATITPAQKLDVVGIAQMTGFKLTTSPAAGQVLTSDATGVGTWQAISDPNAWKLTGNSGTTAGTNFLGTTDNVAFELKVNSTRAFRIEPNTTAPNLIGGLNTNTVTAGVAGAFIGGGGNSGGGPNRITDDYGTVGGGQNNRVGDNAGTTSDRRWATVGGGINNIASGEYATVGGGLSNVALQFGSTVGGGEANRDSASYSTIGGGNSNVIKPGADNATIAGGSGNIISNFYATVGAAYSTPPAGLIPPFPGEPRIRLPPLTLWPPAGRPKRSTPAPSSGPTTREPISPLRLPGSFPSAPKTDCGWPIPPALPRP